MRTIQQSYAKPLVRESYSTSVEGLAADLFYFLGPNAIVEKIIPKLETAYVTILGYDIQMQHFYRVNMEKNENIQSYSTKMEESLNQI